MTLDGEVRKKPGGVYVSWIGLVDVTHRTRGRAQERFGKTGVNLLQEGDRHRFGHVCGVRAIRSAETLTEQNVRFAEWLPFATRWPGVKFWRYKQI